MIAKFFSTQWLGMIAGALPVALAAMITLAILNARLDVRTAERDLLEIEKGIAVDLLERQNEAVAGWKAAAEQNREVYLAGLNAANRRAIRLELDAERILALPSPTDPNERCEAAHALLLTD